MSFILRFLNFNKDISEFEILGKFLTFVEAESSTGLNLSGAIKKELVENRGLDLKNLRGHGYDLWQWCHYERHRKRRPTSHFRWTLKSFLRTMFMPFIDFSGDAAACSGEIFSLFTFSLLQTLYVFFSGSTSRWSGLQKHALKNNIKKVLKIICLKYTMPFRKSRN